MEFADFSFIRAHLLPPPSGVKSPKEKARAPFFGVTWSAMLEGCVIDDSGGVELLQVQNGAPDSAEVGVRHLHKTGLSINVRLKETPRSSRGIYKVDVAAVVERIHIEASSGQVLS